MTAPALQLWPGRRAGRPPESPRTWGSTAVGLAATALLVLFLALGFQPGSAWLPDGRTLDDSRSVPESITFVDVPPATLPPPAEPLPTSPTTPASRQPAGTIAPFSPNTATPTVPRQGQRVSPAPTLPVDSAGRAGAGRLPPRPPEARLPDGLTFPPPARAGAPAPDCVGPCLGGVAGGVSTRAAPLTVAERDSALRAMERSIPALARELERRDGALAPASPPADPGAIPQLKGASIPLGLPGGGPSKAQREHDRRVHAGNSAALARIRARQDSIARADSLERARRGRRPPD
ncbi:MAG TPA: hypothetical protein VGE02_17400 [Gemmatimonadales bacterium]